MTLLDCSAILFASSLTVIASGILISLLIGFKFSWASCLFKFLFSFCLALLTEAKLLSLASISSLKALETVNFNSLFLVPVFEVFLFFISNSFLSLFVALCSANLRFSKSFVINGPFEGKIGLFVLLLLKFGLPFDLKPPNLGELLGFLLKNLLDLFSIITEFFP